MSGQMEMLDDAGAEQEAGTMAALSLWQPWASLIAAGAKRVETRSWETRHRGPVAICSTKTSPPIARSFFENDPHIETVPEIAGGEWADLPVGVVVAVANLVRCTEITLEAAWELEETNPAEHAFGNYHVENERRWAFVLEDVQTIARRIPVSGRQKLWTLPADVERQVCEDVAGRPIG